MATTDVGIPHVARPAEETPDLLAAVVETMREMSRQTDPQEMVKAYGRRMETLMPRMDRFISLSRRGLAYPRFRITRFSGWDDEVNPWKEQQRLPRLKGGILADLIYGDEPRIIDNFSVSPDDPAARYLDGQRTLMALPLYDGGVALNMVIIAREDLHAFQNERLADHVWLANLFGRATHNLVMADEVKTAYELIDRELKQVADIQRSLLPDQLPDISNMKFASHYQTSRRAGGDYYDFFPLGDSKWGILIADVSGHGTPAAVLMAVMHSIAHAFPGSMAPPSKVLEYLNEHLISRYTEKSGTFATAFYGVYDSKSRRFTYAIAGHNPPRIRRCGNDTVFALEGKSQFPLGVVEGVEYADTTTFLQPGDRVVFYTDGITEAENEDGELFGSRRLDEVLSHCREKPEDIIGDILAAVDSFTEGHPASDDRTILAARIF